jgi:uncharacterized protein
MQALLGQSSLRGMPDRRGEERPPHDTPSIVRAALFRAMFGQMTVPESPLLDSLVAALRAGPRLRLAVLFGSAANGALRPDSDVDIAILPEDPGLPLSVELALTVGLSLSCGREVDLVRLDQAPTLVRWQVARHGRVLLEAGPFEAARFIAAAVAEYLDFAPAFELATERFRKSLVEGREGPAP